MNRMLKPLPHRLVSRLPHRMARRLQPQPSTGTTFRPLLARTFTYPQGTGLLGPGTDGLLRTVFVDAFTLGTESAEVLVTRSHLEELFDEDLHQTPFDRLRPSLHLVETLEDAIEHLEERALWDVTGESAKPQPTLWLAIPGPDADVVHRTLTALTELDIIALFEGPWPYGPTHLIDADGPRQLPSRTTLLPVHEAISRLSAAH
ncbi:hypothetical protein ACFYTC_26635 [Actinomadura nitritigenes]|uniref:hypothetical protein n=1 Tax=Actinomadura nitritigenes TaxID=134602 RepID=UPI0036977E98